jgi:hypothetical protein
MEIQEMKELRDKGYTYAAIAAKAGISWTVAYKRLNPGYRREYQRKYRKTQLALKSFKPERKSIGMAITTHGEKKPINEAPKKLSKWEKAE